MTISTWMNCGRKGIGKSAAAELPFIGKIVKYGSESSGYHKRSRYIEGPGGGCRALFVGREEIQNTKNVYVLRKK